MHREISQILKELKLLEYVDKIKTNRDVAILPVSRLKELGIDEEDQPLLLGEFHDIGIIQILNEKWHKEEIVSFDEGEGDIQLHQELNLHPYPKYIVKIVPERFYTVLKDIKKECEKRKSELLELEGGGEKATPFKLVRGTKWENIVIEFLNDEEVEIKAPKVKHKTNFKKMGFEGRGGKPSVQWVFLGVLANHSGEINWGDKEANKRFKKQAQLLAEGLQNYFKLDYDPFYPYRQVKAYKVKMVLIPPPKTKSEPEPDDKNYDRDKDIRDFYNEITQ